jgi:hypothetical protein
MQENFTVSFPNSYNFTYLWKIVISILLAILIIFPALGVGTLQSTLSIIILSLIFFVIILSMTNENLSNELPSTLYPSIPHTGLDGISLNSYVAGSASL